MNCPICNAPLYGISDGIAADAINYFLFCPAQSRFESHYIIYKYHSAIEYIGGSVYGETMYGPTLRATNINLNYLLNRFLIRNQMVEEAVRLMKLRGVISSDFYFD